MTNQAAQSATHEMPPTEKSKNRKIAFATLIGSTIEWYDFFIYASAASLIFGELFFAPAGNTAAILVSFATVGVSFLFRPIGAILAGHFGDRIGRRAMLVLTLLLMGVSTTLIGFLPTFDQIGVAAPVLLIFFRILQGLSAGGEWGGAALMAVEHAPAERRSRQGMFPQLGVPVGMLLASGVMTLMSTVIAPGAAFLEWGWRVPFLISIVLVAVGYWVRRSIEESPVFTAMTEESKRDKVPLVTLMRSHWKIVLLASFLIAGTTATGYLTTGGFFTTYVTASQSGALNRDDVLLWITVSGIFYILFTALGGYLGDLIGRRNTMLLGFGAQLLLTIPTFWLVSTGTLAGFAVAIILWYFGVGVTYGPLAAWYSELFPADVRFSGASITYALGSILGGAFAPLIAAALSQQFGSLVPVAIYAGGMALIGLIAALVLRERKGIDLNA